MTESPARESAQIIPFPSRSRGGRTSARSTLRQSPDRVQFTPCDFGSGWYHDAAMQEEMRKHPPR